MAERDRLHDVNLEDPLGLKGEPIRPVGTERVRASLDEASVRRRRRRAGIGPFGDDRTTSGMGDIGRDHKGATGIDMGAGGQDTQVADDTRD